MGWAGYAMDAADRETVLAAVCEVCTHRGWARHGSTRWLWNDQAVRDAIKYVIDEQGEPMVTFIHEAFR